MTSRFLFISIITATLIFYSSCQRKAEPETFLIPKDYKGTVVVLFDRSNGQEKMIIEGRRIYDIPKEGILRTKFSKTSEGLLDQEYYYKDAYGNKLESLEVYNIGPFDSSRVYILNAEYGSYTSFVNDQQSDTNPVDYRLFSVGNVVNEDSLRKASRRFLEKTVTGE